MRAAMVGGAAYYGGKKVQQNRDTQADQEAYQDARLDSVEAQQYAAPPAPAGGINDNTIEQLTKLGQLHDSGVLTDAEFDRQKQKLLG